MRTGTSADSRLPKISAWPLLQLKILGSGALDPFNFLPIKHTPLRGHDDTLNEKTRFVCYTTISKKGLCAPRRWISDSGRSVLSGKRLFQLHCINMVSEAPERITASLYHLSFTKSTSSLINNTRFNVRYLLLTCLCLLWLQWQR